MNRTVGRVPAARDRDSVWWVAAIGCGSVAAYAVVASAQRDLFLGPELGAPMPVSVATYVAATVVLFVLYGAVLRLCARGGLASSPARVFAVLAPLTANLLLLLSSPSLSSDTLSYVAHGSISTELGGNPLVMPEDSVAGTALEPELRERGWGPGNPPSPYGPLWTAAEVAIVASLDDVDHQVFAFKAVAMLAGWATACLLWIGLRPDRTERRSLGVIAFLWNPLVVVEFAGEGHNDGLMTIFVVAAVVLVLHRRAGAIVALMAAFLTKYLPLLFAPLLLPAWWRARDLGAGTGSRRGAFAGAAALFLVVAYVPWWAGASTFNGVRLAGRPGDTGSTPTIAMQALNRVLGLDISGDGVGLAIVLVGGIALLAAAHSVSEGRLIEWCAGAATVYLLILSPDYWPWYAVLPVALWCLRPSFFPIVLAIALSLGARLAAPLDVLFDHGAIGRSAFLLMTWLLGIGLPLVVGVIAALVVRRSRSNARPAPVTTT